MGFNGEDCDKRGDCDKCSVSVKTLGTQVGPGVWSADVGDPVKCIFAAIGHFEKLSYRGLGSVSR